MQSNNQWRPYRLMSLGLRAVVLCVPIGIALLASMLLGHVVPPGSGLLGIIRIAAIVAGSSAAMMGATSLMQRLMPLVLLLKVSLVFPDAAPSRFQVALRRRVDPATISAGGDSPAEVTAELANLLSRLNRHHRLTRGHSERVRAYADLVAEEMGLSEHERMQLRWAALLHDIGKLTVPVEVLDLPGRPDAEQWKFIANHPRQGEVLAQPIVTWLGPFAAGIWEHHEKFDGSGYPNKLAGTEISLAGRIVALADAFETMTAVRSYKQSMTIEAARAEVVACAGKHFDPDVVRSFLAVGIGSLRNVVGIAALFQVPLLVLDQLTGAAKIAVRTSGAGAVASVAVVAGVAGNVSIAPAAPAVAVSVPASIDPAPPTSVLTIALPSAPDVRILSAAPQRSIPPDVISPVAEEMPTTLAPTTNAPATVPDGRPLLLEAAAVETTVPTTVAVTSRSTTTTTAKTTTTTAAVPISVVQTTTTSTTVASAAARPVAPPPAPTTTTLPRPTPAPTTAAPTTVAPTTTVASQVVRAVDDEVDVQLGVWTSISLLDNDTGPFVPTISGTRTRSGNLSISNINGAIRVQAGGGSRSDRSFEYTICSAARVCSTATVTIHIV